MLFSISCGLPSSCKTSNTTAEVWQRKNRASQPQYTAAGTKCQQHPAIAARAEGAVCHQPRSLGAHLGLTLLHITKEALSRHPPQLQRLLPVTELQACNKNHILQHHCPVAFQELLYKPKSWFSCKKKQRNRQKRSAWSSS